MARRLLPLFFVAAAAACTRGALHTEPRDPHAIATRKPGAVLLASSGSTVSGAFVVSGAPSEIVRGRTRWHLEAEGAVRARLLSPDPIHTAVSLPPWLGGGLALFADDAVMVAKPTGEMYAVARAALVAPSIGAAEIWARVRGGGDWVRLDLAHGTVALHRPPIAAPILTSWPSAVNPLIGRPATAGPEHLSPKIALAIVDVLGPVFTHDGGETWTPLQRDAVRAAFPDSAGPVRILRDGKGLLLATDARTVPISPTGQLGTPHESAPAREPIPDIASIRVEMVAPHGVPLADGSLLVSDGNRLAIVSLDPVRTHRVSRITDLTRCDLRPSLDPHVLAVAACIRHDEGPLSSGAQLVVGTVVDAGSALQFAAEKVFPFSAGMRMSAAGAVVVAGACSGVGDVSGDLLAAAKVCVRDVKGAWGDVAVVGVGARRALLPKSDGGVIIVRDEPVVGTELLTLPKGALPITAPRHVAFDQAPVPLVRELLSVDEVEPGRVVAWRDVDGALKSTTVTLGDAPKTTHGPPLKIETGMVIGLHADRAMIALVSDKPKTIGVAPTTSAHKPTLEKLVVSTNAGAIWSNAAWPEAARLLDTTSSGRIADCGALGCRFLGWSRLGWDTNVASYDEVVDTESASTLAAAPAPPKPSSTLRAKCTITGAVTPFDPAKVPLHSGMNMFMPPPRDTLLGHPEPKAAPGQVVLLAPFSRGSTRGGLISVGPTAGTWGDLARTFVRFGSDLDPLGAVHETAMVPAPFGDRLAAQRAMNVTFAVPLGPARILLSVCDGRCAIYRAVAGAAIEPIDLGPTLDVRRVINARELGDALFIVGFALSREPKSGFIGAEDQTPFVAVVSATGTKTQWLARTGIADDGVVGTADVARGRFGLHSHSKLPTWLGGTSYVLPLDASMLPSGAVEALAPGGSEISRPTKACSSTTSGWDRGEMNRKRTLFLEIVGEGTSILAGDGGSIRSRISTEGACLERFTLLSPRASFQYEASTKRAVLLSIDDANKGAKRHELSCSLAWED